MALGIIRSPYTPYSIYLRRTIGSGFRVRLGGCFQLTDPTMYIYIYNHPVYGTVQVCWGSRLLKNKDRPHFALSGKGCSGGLRSQNMQRIACPCVLNMFYDFMSFCPKHESAQTLRRSLPPIASKLLAIHMNYPASQQS